MNDKLARLINEAGYSHKSFARAVRDTSSEAGTPIGCDHTSVSRWLNGVKPRADAAQVIVTTLSRALGRAVTLADAGLAAAERLPLDLGLSVPQAAEDGIETVSRLWQADLNEASVVLREQVNPAAWNEASLTWLLSPSITPAQVRDGRRVGQSDVQRFQATIGLFTQMDNRFGGGHARHALIQYLSSDAPQLLKGNFNETTGHILFSAVAEATLLAAWMSYDSGLHSLAQRYFIQALSLARAGDDRLLAASILDAMSHQATFMGRFREAANLAQAARQGTRGIATPTLTAHFLAMEARALARLGDARACDRVLSQAVTEFERRNPDNDPEWIRYFDDAELAAEFGHCLRDLGRPVNATQYATQCLGSIDGETYQRSDFFATMVLADAHLAAGDAEQACTVALKALRLGDQLRSSRCLAYVQEFSKRLAPAASSSALRGFQEEAIQFSLWQQIAYQ
ncbi:tetratricopeptide (TPR) repeat protein [Thermocatellispora tengchongensis]|uniref:Tetratricopeptide (TPR) repeat protein n=1 Tax=Thermocatellispora tengchongensis TaxID=1073253 RepID=A0A840P327_9ACTN|nr:hypothetical protein [Thermocatellispora tengchongensis]MBB5132896.1 tetratricopeptide (TPR) repeat protein [Thermocatellispora tengchongensis]